MTNSAQSELYLGPQRQSGDYAKMLRGQPDAVVFNSYYDQYLYAPLHVAAGQPGTSTPAPPAGDVPSLTSRWLPVVCTIFLIKTMATVDS